MTKYIKNNIPYAITVTSVISVHHSILTGRHILGEKHDFPELFFVEKGTHSVYIDAIQYDLSENQLIIFAPNSFHEATKPSSATVGIVGFEANSSILEPIYNRIITLSSKQKAHLTELITHGNNCFTLANNVARGMVPKANVSELDLQLFKNRLELLLITLLLPDKTSDSSAVTRNHTNYSYEQLDIITEYMLAHITEVLTLKDISRGCALSPSKLNRICNELVGESPVSYFTYLKISEAQRLIKETSLNFTQISERLGFNSVQYFSRLFKQRVRITPSEYAKLASRENS